MVKPASITRLQKSILDNFSHSPLAKQFYWSGGTALTFFYLYHRRSYDIDFFSDTRVEYRAVRSFVQLLSENIPLRNITERRVFDRWEFFLKDHEEARVEFVHYDFKNLKPRKKWKGILVDSLDDMAANKTMAMIDRKEPKDAFDVCTLIKKRRYTPESLLALAKKKFGLSVPVSVFWGEGIRGAEALSDLRPLLFGTKQSQDRQIKEVISYFQKGAAELVRERLA